MGWCTSYRSLHLNIFAAHKNIKLPPPRSYRIHHKTTIIPPPPPLCRLWSSPAPRTNPSGLIGYQHPRIPINARSGEGGTSPPPAVQSQCTLEHGVLAERQAGLLGGITVGNGRHVCWSALLCCCYRHTNESTRTVLIHQHH